MLRPVCLDELPQWLATLELALQLLAENHLLFLEAGTDAYWQFMAAEVRAERAQCRALLHYYAHAA